MWLTPREGNRQRGFLQGVYPTAVDGEWVAISVRDDVGLGPTIACSTNAVAACRPSTLDRPSPRWSISLTHSSVPAEQVLTADRMYDIAQLDARGYYQELEHPITGVAPLSGLAVSHHAGTRSATIGSRRRRSGSTTTRSCAALA